MKKYQLTYYIRSDRFISPVIETENIHKEMDKHLSYPFFITSDNFYLNKDHVECIKIKEIKEEHKNELI